MHVLLIEDDPLVASGIRSGLMMYHFVVEHVTSVQAARQAMQSVASDVVILDRGLPDGDGLALLQSWRDEGVTTPVLMLTEPFDLDELVARLHALLRRVAGRSQVSFSSRRLGHLCCGRLRAAFAAVAQ